MTILFILSSEVMVTLELWMLMIDLAIVILTAIIVILLH